MPKSEIRVEHWEEFARGRDYAQEVTIKHTNTEEYEDLADGAGEPDHQAVEEELWVAEDARVAVFGGEEGRVGVDEAAEYSTHEIIYKHTRISKIPLRLLVLLICLRASQPIEKQTAEEQQEAEQVVRFVVASFLFCVLLCLEKWERLGERVGEGNGEGGGSGGGGEKGERLRVSRIHLKKFISFLVIIFFLAIFFTQIWNSGRME